MSIVKTAPRKSTRPAHQPSAGVAGAAFPAGPPVAPRREALSRRPRAFGAGLLASMPNYRLDCTLTDLAWWESRAEREEDAMFDRMGREYEAQQRMERGLDV